MKIQADPRNHNCGSDAVASQKDLKLTKDSPKQPLENFEIERSQYYLGRALYRYSLLKKERSGNGNS